jgi:hypothetical protein
LPVVIVSRKDRASVVSKASEIIAVELSSRAKRGICFSSPPANSRSLALKLALVMTTEDAARNIKCEPEPGDLIRIIRVPEAAQDTDGFKTRSTLERCIGRVFPITGFNSEGMIQIDVGEVLGKASSLESIWIEPECVARVSK